MARNKKPLNFMEKLQFIEKNPTLYKTYRFKGIHKIFTVMNIVMFLVYMSMLQLTPTPAYLNGNMTFVSIMTIASLTIWFTVLRHKLRQLYWKILVHVPVKYLILPVYDHFAK